ncbi:MAG: hypothetical protein ACREXR_11580, partial [Gammaproteobacteria bacterium]
MKTQKRKPLKIDMYLDCLDVLIQSNADPDTSPENRLSLHALYKFFAGGLDIFTREELLELWALIIETHKPDMDRLAVIKPCSEDVFFDYFFKCKKGPTSPRKVENMPRYQARVKQLIDRLYYVNEADAYMSDDETFPISHDKAKKKHGETFLYGSKEHNTFTEYTTQQQSVVGLVCDPARWAKGQPLVQCDDGIRYNYYEPGPYTDVVIEPDERGRAWLEAYLRMLSHMVDDNPPDFGRLLQWIAWPFIYPEHGRM